MFMNVVVSVLKVAPSVIVETVEEALAADLVVTVTPGRNILFPEGSLRPGQHVSLRATDFPGSHSSVPCAPTCTSACMRLAFSHK